MNYTHRNQTQTLYSTFPYVYVYECMRLRVCVHVRESLDDMKLSLRRTLLEIRSRTHKTLTLTTLTTSCKQHSLCLPFTNSIRLEYTNTHVNVDKITQALQSKVVMSIQQGHE